MSESTSGWLTVSQAAAALHVDPRTIRRLIKAETNAALTRRVTRTTRTGTRQTTEIAPELLEKWREEREIERGANADTNAAQQGHNADINAAQDGANTAQDGITGAERGEQGQQGQNTGTNAALTRLEGFVMHQALQNAIAAAVQEAVAPLLADRQELLQRIDTLTAQIEHLQSTLNSANTEATTPPSPMAVEGTQSDETARNEQIHAAAALSQQRATIERKKGLRGWLLKMLRAE